MYVPIEIAPQVVQDACLKKTKSEKRRSTERKAIPKGKGGANPKRPNTRREMWKPDKTIYETQ